MIRDRNTVPILSGEHIEALAERFLEKQALQCLLRPVQTPVFFIPRRLAKEGFFQYCTSTRLGFDSTGRQYLGAYDVKNKILYIDRDLFAQAPDQAHDPRLPFTIAHELGHFYLHWKINPAVLDNVTGTSTTAERSDENRELVSDSGVIRDTAEDIILGRFQTDNPRTILEWQANRFAGALLIPRRTLPPALVAVQTQMGINGRRGTIWRTNQPGSERDFRMTVRLLSDYYRTSQAVMRIRLYTLNLVREQGVPVPMRRLGDVIGDALHDLFDDRSGA
jgi:Zn-dependent peptidase ImmA (M78 family)